MNVQLKANVQNIEIAVEKYGDINFGNKLSVGTIEIADCFNKYFVKSMIKLELYSL